MHNVDKLIAVVLAAVFSAFFSVAAQAQSFRTFVSGTGSDTGACGVSAPCRSFAYALGETSAGGEIVVLSSAGYGPVTINQAVTISNPGGVEAGITGPSGGNAVTITATSGAVTLRGLTLEGGGSATNGVALTSSLPMGSTLTVNILDCVIKDFSGDGILLAPTNSSNMGGTPFVTVVIADSTITGNGTGIAATPGLVNLRPSIYRTIVDSNNGTGLNLSYGSSGGTVDALLIFSHVDNNTGTGIQNGATLIMKNSSALVNGGINDIVNNLVLDIFDRNTIGVLSGNGGGSTDGTNTIQSNTGGSLIKITPQ